MNFLVVNPVTPRRAHSVNAAPVVVFELIAAIAARVTGCVGFLKLTTAGPNAIDPADAQGLEDLQALGVAVLPPFILPKPRHRRRAWKTLVSPQLTDFYPEAGEQRALAEHIADFKPDVVFVPWSEWATALCAELPATRFAYYGNPDPKNWQLQLEMARRTGASALRYWLGRGLGVRLERLHLEVMNRFAILGNVAANDADYYRHKGHPNAFYLQNVWIDRFGDAWRARRDNAERPGPTMIIGNVGKLRATANTLGMEVLGRDLMPKLRHAMAGRPFEMHLLGSGDPHPLLGNLLQQPEIKCRGFVPDIDEEMLAAPIFLCMNNASMYKVGHTRYLHAWSLGSCVVAHADAALSMPELRHEENCLLGRSSREIAELIARAAADPVLRRRVGEGGYATFRNHFTADVVAPRILEKLTALST